MGIVCEYLPVDLQEKLASKLDLPAPTHKKAEPVIGRVKLKYFREGEEDSV